MGVKPEDFVIVWLGWSAGRSLAAVVVLLWLPTLSDAGWRSLWNKQWEVLVFPSFLISICRLVLKLWYQLVVSSPEEYFYKKVKMLSGMGIEDYGS